MFIKGINKLKTNFSFIRDEIEEKISFFSFSYFLPTANKFYESNNNSKKRISVNITQKCVDVGSAYAHSHKVVVNVNEKKMGKMYESHFMEL